MDFLAVCLAIVIIDATTIHCGAEEVQIFGISCPDVRSPAGMNARRTLELILTGRHIELKRKGRNAHGRTVAKVFADGRDVACQMVRGGLCREGEDGGEYEDCRAIPWPPRRGS
jgi:micrococcal nuclease